MRIRLTKKGLARRVNGNRKAVGVIAEADIRVGKTRLWNKLIVFKTQKALRDFWKHYLKRGDLGQRCCGAVTALDWDYWRLDENGKRHHIITKEFDPRYICLIGLVKTHLTARIITHECVHAGMAYARRVKKTPWDDCIKTFDEEAVCYPAGEIAQAVVNYLYKTRLLAHNPQ